MMEASQILRNFEYYIVNPAILVIFALGFFLFIWGLVEFIMNLDKESSRETGVKHMLWGIIGMFIMVAVYGIIALLNNTFDLGVSERPGGGFDFSVDPGRLPADATFPGRFQ